MFEKKIGIYRLIYLVIYIILIIYPLYRILEYASLLEQLFQVIVLGGLVLVFLAIIFGMPELIAIYYIVAGLVYKVNYVPGAPGLHEVILYSIFILHADILSKLITIGVGSRRIRVSIKGIPLTIIVPTIMISIYIILAYYVLNMFLRIVDNVVYSSELSRIVLTTFLSTRIGSLLLFVFIIFGVFFVLTNFVTDLASDTIWLTPSYAKNKIMSWLKREYRELLENKTWHQKLYTSAITTLFIFITMSIIYPILVDVIEPVSNILGEFIPESEIRLFSFFLVLPISYLIGKSFRNWAYGTVDLERQRRIARRELESALVVHKSDPFLYLLLTIAYLVFLMQLDPNLPYYVINRVLGIGTAPGTIQHPLFRGVVETLNSLARYINENLVRYLNDYILRATNEYKRLIELIKTAIKLLW